MRSWNHVEFVLMTMFDSCSQFTNEELKPLGIPAMSSGRYSFAIYQWGVETSPPPWVSWRTPSSQFTNEELKLCLIRSHDIVQYGFAIYQWGVETRKIFKAIWTTWPGSQFTNEELKLYLQIRLFSIYRSSQFTNEELKLSTFCKICRSLFLFAIYQWGVETRNSWNTYYSRCFGSQFTNEELKHKRTLPLIPKFK